MTKDELIKQLLDEGALRVDLEQGLVFSNRGHQKYPGRPLGSSDGWDYFRTKVHYQGIDYNMLVHRIVAIAAFGLPEPGLEVAHLNHTRTDNRAANLAFVTHQENLRQTEEAGYVNRAKGEKNGRAKLTSIEVQEIRETYAEGEVTQHQLAEKYGVSDIAIKTMVTGQTWKDAPGPITRRGPVEGESHGCAKLTRADVCAIRDAYAGGVTLRELAARHSVGYSSIWNVVTGKTWKEVEAPG